MNKDEIQNVLDETVKTIAAEYGATKRPMPVNLRKALSTVKGNCKQNGKVLKVGLERVISLISETGCNFDIQITIKKK